MTSGKCQSNAYGSHIYQNKNKTQRNFQIELQRLKTTWDHPCLTTSPLCLQIWVLIEINFLFSIWQFFSTHRAIDLHIFIIYSLKLQNNKSETLTVCDTYNCCSMHRQHLSPLKKLSCHPKKTEHMLPFPCSSPTDVNKRSHNAIQTKIVWILLLLYSKHGYNHGVCILTCSHLLSHPSPRKI